MPEYLAPGVYVEETSFRQKTIEGVSTSTTGFIGATRFGPLEGEPPLLTSFNDFERIYGGIDQLEFDGEETTHNFLAHGVRAYFEEGGRRLYVARVFQAIDEGDDGVARLELTGSPPDGGLSLRARYPGAAGNVQVQFLLRVGENALREEPDDPADPLGSMHRVLRGVPDFSVVRATLDQSPAPSPEFYWVERYFDEGVQRETHRLWRAESASPPVAIPLDEVADVRVVTASVTVDAMGQFSDEQAWENLPLDPRHRDSLTRVFAIDPQAGEPPVRRFTELYVPLGVSTTLPDGQAIADVLGDQPSVLDGAPVSSHLDDPDASDAARSFRVLLTGGNDGVRPQPADYQGDEAADGRKSGLLAFEDLEEISILAAPGHTHSHNDAVYASAVTRLLIAHSERMRYRIAVLDSVDGHVLSKVRDWRSSLDSTRAAFYYPWVRVVDPVTEVEIDLPPSGFVCGVYARNDTERGVHKSPANEVVRLAQGFEILLNRAQQDVLNPEGVNCLRFFEGRGYRVWGARTATSDPEWKYVNVRRYFLFLERSIEKGTQWAVFENNGPVLWANVTRTVSDFLFNEWKQNHLLGNTPDEAFFVRCDRSTMTQNDLDNGRLVCLIGVSPLRPAEFVIFRIGQKTADARG